MILVRRLTVVALMLCLVVVGCSKKRMRQEEDEVIKTITFQPGTGAGPAVMKVTPIADRTAAANDLKSIWTVAMADTTVPPPGSLEQFVDLRRENSRLYNGVKEGHYVICWKADRNKPKAIFAYQMEAPEKGGPVVLVDGTVIMNMTPQEFQNTPKGGIVTPPAPPGKAK
jgi:hypothetical protein